jgi:hypothetical protein
MVRLCIECGKRKALSPCHSPHGNRGMKQRKQHPYCAECFRNLRNHVQAQSLAATEGDSGEQSRTETD